MKKRKQIDQRLSIVMNRDYREKIRTLSLIRIKEKLKHPLYVEFGIGLIYRGGIIWCF